MTPLIDMVFILLIFFIVTTAFVTETGVEIERPRSGQAHVLDRSVVLVAVTESGSVHLAGRRIAVDDHGALAAALASSGARTLIIQADGQAPLAVVLAVQDAGYAAGAEVVSIGAVAP
jgi:biopolymer transport protein ExbD